MRLPLLSRLLAPRARADHLVVTVYSRAECSCCDRARAVIEPRRLRHGFRVEVVDVDADPALAEAYGGLVPVVSVDGKVRFRGEVDPALLDRLLEAEADRKTHIQASS
ncbi:glutaredoxin family protein [Tautonia plasticadhaerens]|uniref:Glutaredoxin n=1 Tax=Tautonia plasticadhaerens TaxID=2527974 RepID=A0A518HCF8_9BACT|nr:glutaredoxin family protein [Tautonia plasticadhaerens]QDV38544.1 Glutaredoxin [Tautonia plasticadhaerens]